MKSIFNSIFPKLNPQKSEATPMPGIMNVQEKEVDRLREKNWLKLKCLPFANVTKIYEHVNTFLRPLSDPWKEPMQIK